MCRSELREVIRSTIADNLIDMLQYKCTNVGCEYVGNADAMKVHEDKCGFAMIQCPVCKGCLKRNEMKNHIETRHDHLFQEQGQMVTISRPVPSDPRTVLIITDNESMYCVQCKGTKIGDEIGLLIWVVVKVII